jgi:hypothetical protein
LRAKQENCYVKIKRYTVRVAADKKKNPEFRKRTRRAGEIWQRRNVLTVIEQLGKRNL